MGQFKDKFKSDCTSKESCKLSLTADLFDFNKDGSCNSRNKFYFKAACEF